MPDTTKRPAPPATPPVPPATTIIVQQGGTMTPEMYAFMLALTRALSEARAEIVTLKNHLGI